MSFLSLEIKSSEVKQRKIKHFQLAVDWSSCPWSLEIISRAGFKQSAQQQNSIFEALANFYFFASQ